MATNPPPGAGRRVEVKKRDQVYSPRNSRWTKRGADKKFMDQRAKKAANRNFPTRGQIERDNS